MSKANRSPSTRKAEDIFLIVVGGLEVQPVQSGMPDEFFIADGLIGQITGWIIENSNRPQDEMGLLMSIQIVAIVLSRRLISETGDTPNIYQIVTAKSGTGKDWPRQAAMIILIEALAHHLLGTETVTSATSIITLASICPSVLFLIDEVGKVISAIKSRNAGNTEKKIETLLLKLWSSALSRKFRHKGFAKVEDNIEICRPSVGFYGTATPDSIYGNGSLDLTSIVDGFLSRCILFDADAKAPPIAASGAD